MSKKLKDLKWDTVAVEGFPVSFSDKFQGFVGLEECTDYALDKETKKIKKKQKKMKKKRQTEDTTVEIPSKKLKTEKETVRLSNGFLVESCEITTPSFANEKDMKSKKGNTKFNNSIKKKEAPKKAIDKQRKCNINKKPKLGECMNETISDLTPEDMLTWAEFKLQEPIMKALTELGFKKPTKIQELTLPAAIHGRRDILGAAETGSGKTLAFGLPILSGIMKLKEKAELGHDVYELPYKKTSVKKKVKQQERNKNNARTNRDKKRNEQKLKESSEDGYGTDEGSDDSKKYDNNRITNIETQLVNNKSKNIQSIKDKRKPGKKVNNDDDYLEEFNVPIKTRKLSVDEDDDSDDSENYTHLSEMIDSDDLDETSDDDNVTANCIESGDTEDEDEKTDQLENASSSDDDEIDDESNEDNTEEINENEQGMGCVKVIDNVEIPGHVVIKTGKLLYALILTPTRELAMQISRHLMAVAKYTGIKVATVVGGMAVVKQERVLRSGPEVVVATPGRLWELINQGQPHLQQLNSVKFLAIDETDRMIERGHFEELHPLLERLNSDDNTRGARQNFVFSATLTMVHDLPTHMKRKKVTKRGKIINRRIEKMTSQQKIKRLINMIGMTDPKVVDITTSNLGTAETLTESRITCSLEHKDAYLYYIIKRHPGRTIVFCNSIGSVRRLAQLMSLLKCNPLPLHASMPQRQRLKNLERFRDDPHGVLVATDVAARGLDIPNVDHVIHYQVPKTAENYVHRSGRTARATKEGLTILMMEPSEAYLYAKLCQTLNKTSELPTFPVVPQCLSSFKELVSLARTVDGLLLRKRRATQASGWRDKAAKDMDMIIDDDDLPVKQVDPSIDKELQIRKRQLESLLSRPMFPKGFSFKYPTLNDTLLVTNTEENALQVMKKALESGQLKKEKRKSKNAPLLKLQKN